MHFIPLADMLHLLRTTADPCTIVFSTADRQRRTGGELVRLEGCVKTGVEKQGPGRAAPGTPPTPAGPAPPAAGGQPTRRPNHRANQTINLTLLSSGKVRTVHVRLITEYNGQKVRW